MAKKFRAKFIKRDSGKADDKTTLDPVIYDAYKKASDQERIVYDLVVTLQTTSPLLSGSNCSKQISQKE